LIQILSAQIQIKVGDLLRNNDDLERLRSEVWLDKNIIKFYNSGWTRKTIT
jgi:WNK lysine deficient protein kinase